MRELFEFKIKEPYINGYSLTELLGLLETEGGTFGSLNSIFIRKEDGSITNLKCAYNTVLNKKGKATCANARKKMNITGCRSCKECYSMAIRNYLSRKYVDITDK